MLCRTLLEVRQTLKTLQQTLITNLACCSLHDSPKAGPPGEQASVPVPMQALINHLQRLPAVAFVQLPAMICYHAHCSYSHGRVALSDRGDREYCYLAKGHGLRPHAHEDGALEQRRRQLVQQEVGQDVEFEAHVVLTETYRSQHC